MTDNLSDYTIGELKGEILRRQRDVPTAVVQPNFRPIVAAADAYLAKVKTRPIDPDNVREQFVYDLYEVVLQSMYGDRVWEYLAANGID